MIRTSDNMHIVFPKKLSSHAKSQDVPRESRTLVLGIPIARDLSRIRFRQDWIKDWLLRQPWRKRAKLAASYKVHFSLSHRPVECCDLNSHRSRILAQKVPHPSRVFGEKVGF